MNIKIGTIVNHPGSTFNGELQEKYNVILSGLIARNRDRTLHLFLLENVDEKRELMKIESEGFWIISAERIYDETVLLDKSLFPDVKWEDEYPTEVQIRIQ